MPRVTFRKRCVPLFWMIRWNKACYSYVFLALGWAATAALVYKVINATPGESVLYDPFEILGIARVRAPLTLICPPTHPLLGSYREGDQVPLQEAVQDLVCGELCEMNMN